ncbi:MAG: methionyl-tRNA formyltransferase [Akkermansiaceae bacterium]|nr:methionyl-tRNA formyltransferase [Akkermansiaceae bacterium]MDG1854422.1 methionyl-tRNA formyltransferase [Verrucomicrobiales bacterium]
MKIVFLGTGDIGLPSLSAIQDSKEHEILAVYTQPDRPFGRKGNLKASEIKIFAELNSIPVHQPEKIREVEAVEGLVNYSPDIILVIAYGQILPKSVLDIPKIACINLHASLLPYHRGAAPIQASILAGDARTGVTVMYVDEGLDDGDILFSISLDIRASETGGSLHERLGKLGPDALIHSLDLLSSGSAPREEQDHEIANHVNKIKRSDGKINWSKSAYHIDRLIRAYDPWPGTFTFFPDHSNIKIFPPVEIVEYEGSDPGEIIDMDSNGILVACGTGALRISEIQPSGRRRMLVSAYVAGKELKAGDVLGVED